MLCKSSPTLAPLARMRRLRANPFTIFDAHTSTGGRSGGQILLGNIGEDTEHGHHHAELSEEEDEELEEAMPSSTGISASKILAQPLRPHLGTSGTVPTKGICT